MRMIEKYIVIKDNVIIDFFETSEGIDGVKKSINYNYDDIKKVDINSEHKRKTNVDEYEENGKLKKLSKRVADGYVKLPDNVKLENEMVVNKTIEEKVNDGIIEISPLQKAVGNEIIMKTDEELVNEGIKTQKEINDEKQILDDEKLIAEEMRKMVIEKLGDKLKVVKK